MCLIGFHINDHPAYKLIVAANRDEFFNRPTKQASFWEDDPTLLAGRDLLHKGTWLGITKTGRFAALTNYRKLDSLDDTKRSRGDITTEFLQTTVDASDYLKTLRKKREQYNGFNTVVGTIDQLYYYGNYQEDIVKLEKGTYGLSNALLNTPWPKVTQLKTLLHDYVSKMEKVDIDTLFSILKRSDIAKDDDLPNTGVGLQLERQLSPIFINTGDYGTRCSTVILVTHTNHVIFVERTYNGRSSYKEVQFTFQIEK